MVEARSVSGIFGDPTLPRHRRLHLEACRVPGAGAWLTANPSCVDSQVSSPLFRVALQRRLRMPLWDRDTACSVWGGSGVITPLPVAVVGIGFCATTQSGMWSAPRSLSSLRSRLSLRSLASFSPRGPPILGVPTPMSTPPLFLPHSLPLVAALPIFGFPGASLASLRPGTSRFPRCFAPLTSLLHPPLLPISSTKLKPGNAFSRARLHLRPSARPPSARLSWRLAGSGWSQAYRSVVAWIASESRMARGPTTGSPMDISLRIAQRISCTLHRENARAILRRSPGSVNGSSGLSGDQVPSSGW